MRISKPPERRRAELLEAARFLFDKNGIGHTRVSDIVQYVGVAQGVFYYYFSSKAEIVDAVAQQVSEETQQSILSILSDCDSPFYKKLFDYIALYIYLIDQFLGDDEETISFFDDEFYQQNPFAQQSQSLLAENWEILIDEGVKNGFISIQYPKQTAMVLLLGLRSLSSIRLPTRLMIYTIIEQGLNLPVGSLTQYLPTT